MFKSRLPRWAKDPIARMLFKVEPIKNKYHVRHGKGVFSLTYHLNSSQRVLDDHKRASDELERTLKTMK